LALFDLPVVFLLLLLLDDEIGDGKGLSGILIEFDGIRSMGGIMGGIK
jgi:hypothetical protein